MSPTYVPFVKGVLGGNLGRPRGRGRCSSTALVSRQRFGGGGGPPGGAHVLGTFSGGAKWPGALGRCFSKGGLARVCSRGGIEGRSEAAVRCFSATTCVNPSLFICGFCPEGPEGGLGPCIFCPGCAPGRLGGTGGGKVACSSVTSSKSVSSSGPGPPLDGLFGYRPVIMCFCYALLPLEHLGYHY